MGKKSTPAAPAAPDPVATANAQASANTQAAITQANLNRIDQVTPQGSIRYSQIGTNADGTPRYQQTQTYSPDQQALYDQQNGIAQSLGNLAQDNVSRVQQAQSTPFSFAGMNPLMSSIAAGALAFGTPAPAAQTQVAPSGQVQSGYNAGGAIQSSFGTGGPLTSNVAAGGVQNQIQGAGGVTSSVPGGTYQNQVAPAGGIQTGVQGGQYATSIAGAGDVTRGVQAGPVQGNLNYGGSFSPGDFNGAAQQASNSAYAAAAARLDPQFAQQESDLRARLANSGISENSDAYRREMDNFSRSRTDAYGQAQNNAYGQGLAAQAQGYGQALNTRQQNVGEITQAGQFANAAQQQQFAQGQANAALNNAAQGQVFGQNAAQAQQQNAGTSAQFAQGLQQGQFGNAAQQQQFAQNAAQLDAYNNAVTNQFNQAQQNAAMNNTAQNQQFNQGLASAQLNNNVRQQQIQEASYLRNMPLNDIAALLGTGGGVQNPTFQNFAQVGVAAPDYQGAVYANYNAANQQYQQAQANRSSGLGSIFGLAGTLGAAKISDRRAKVNIKRIGTLANGLATYTYNYVRDTAQQFGVMAQEALNIVPEAVGMTDNGVLYVDYAKVWHGK